MLAQQNEYLKEAVSGVAVLTKDEQILQQCHSREDFEYWEHIKENGHQRELKEKDNFYQQVLTEKDRTIADLKTRLVAAEAQNQ